jgi:hypothetical protein
MLNIHKNKTPNLFNDFQSQFPGKFLENRLVFQDAPSESPSSTPEITNTKKEVTASNVVDFKEFTDPQLAKSTLIYNGIGYSKLEDLMSDVLGKSKKLYIQKSDNKIILTVNDKEIARIGYVAPVRRVRRSVSLPKMDITPFRAEIKKSIEGYLSNLKQGVVLDFYGATLNSNFEDNVAVDHANKKITINKVANISQIFKYIPLGTEIQIKHDNQTIDAIWTRTRSGDRLVDKNTKKAISSKIKSGTELKFTGTQNPHFQAAIAGIEKNHLQPNLKYGEILKSQKLESGQSAETIAEEYFNRERVFETIYYPVLRDEINKPNTQEKRKQREEICRKQALQQFNSLAKTQDDTAYLIAPKPNDIEKIKRQIRSEELNQAATSRPTTAPNESITSDQVKQTFSVDKYTRLRATDSSKFNKAWDEQHLYRIDDLQLAFAKEPFNVKNPNQIRDQLYKVLRGAGYENKISGERLLNLYLTNDAFSGHFQKNLANKTDIKTKQLFKNAIDLAKAIENFYIRPLKPNEKTTEKKEASLHDPSKKLLNEIFDSKNYGGELEKNFIEKFFNVEKSQISMADTEKGASHEFNQYKEKFLLKNLSARMRAISSDAGAFNRILSRFTEIDANGKSSINKTKLIAELNIYIQAAITRLPHDHELFKGEKDPKKIEAKKTELLKKFKLDENNPSLSKEEKKLHIELIRFGYTVVEGLNSLKQERNFFHSNPLVRRSQMAALDLGIEVEKLAEFTTKFESELKKVGPISLFNDKGEFINDKNSIKTLDLGDDFKIKIHNLKIDENKFAISTILSKGEHQHKAVETKFFDLSKYSLPKNPEARKGALKNLKYDYQTKQLKLNDKELPSPKNDLEAKLISQILKDPSAKMSDIQAAYEAIRGINFISLRLGTNANGVTVEEVAGGVGIRKKINDNFTLAFKMENLSIGAGGTLNGKIKLNEKVKLIGGIYASTKFGARTSADIGAFGGVVISEGVYDHTLMAGAEIGIGFYNGIPAIRAAASLGYQAEMDKEKAQKENFDKILKANGWDKIIAEKDATKKIDALKKDPKIGNLIKFIQDRPLQLNDQAAIEYFEKVILKESFERGNIDFWSSARITAGGIGVGGEVYILPNGQPIPVLTVGLFLKIHLPSGKDSIITQISSPSSKYYPQISKAEFNKILRRQESGFDFYASSKTPPIHSNTLLNGHGAYQAQIEQSKASFKPRETAENPTEIIKQINDKLTKNQSRFRLELGKDKKVELVDVSPTHEKQNTHTKIFIDPNLENSALALENGKIFLKINPKAALSFLERSVSFPFRHAVSRTLNQRILVLTDNPENFSVIAGTNKNFISIKPNQDPKIVHRRLASTETPNLRSDTNNFELNKDFEKEKGDAQTEKENKEKSYNETKRILGIVEKKENPIDKKIATALRKISIDFLAKESDLRSQYLKAATIVPEAPYEKHSKNLNTIITQIVSEAKVDNPTIQSLDINDPYILSALRTSLAAESFSRIKPDRKFVQYLIKKYLKNSSSMPNNLSAYKKYFDKRILPAINATRKDLTLKQLTNSVMDQITDSMQHSKFLGNLSVMTVEMTKDFEAEMENIRKNHPSLSGKIQGFTAQQLGKFVSDHMKNAEVIHHPNEKPADKISAEKGYTIASFTIKRDKKGKRLLSGMTDISYRPHDVFNILEKMNFNLNEGGARGAIAAIIYNRMNPRPYNPFNTEKSDNPNVNTDITKRR